MTKNIKKMLEAHGFTKIEIEKYLQYYNYAIDKKIPYAEYYALIKLKH